MLIKGDEIRGGAFVPKFFGKEKLEKVNFKRCSTSDVFELDLLGEYKN